MEPQQKNLLPNLPLDPSQRVRAKGALRNYFKAACITIVCFFVIFLPSTIYKPSSFLNFVPLFGVLFGFIAAVFGGCYTLKKMKLSKHLFIVPLLSMLSGFGIFTAIDRFNTTINLFSNPSQQVIFTLLATAGTIALFVLYAVILERNKMPLLVRFGIVVGIFTLTVYAIPTFATSAGNQKTNAAAEKAIKSADFTIYMPKEALTATYLFGVYNQHDPITLAGNIKETVSYRFDITTKQNPGSYTIVSYKKPMTFNPPTDCARTQIFGSDNTTNVPCEKVGVTTAGTTIYAVPDRKVGDTGYETVGYYAEIKNTVVEILTVGEDTSVGKLPFSIHDAIRIFNQINPTTYEQLKSLSGRPAGGVLNVW